MAIKIDDFCKSKQTVIEANWHEKYLSQKISLHNTEYMSVGVYLVNKQIVRA